MTVPVACWRKAHSRELVETEPLPPPSTCYGMLLALVGETDREVHRGCRVTAGLLNEPRTSTVLRSFWQIKDKAVPQGNKANAGPDFQQLVVGSDIAVWCDSSEEKGASDGLEARVRSALRKPAGIRRFGGLSLGESTHLVNDLWELPDGLPPTSCRAFLLDPSGAVTMPVWVDHVGSAGTRYAVGNMVRVDRAPDPGRLPQIPS